jgi:transcriptional regulator of nitric oxide reductase
MSGVFMKDLNLLVWLTQLGLSVAVPLGGFVWLAVWLRNRYNWGVWVIIVGVLLGLYCAIDGLVRNLKALQRMEKKEKEEDR